MCARTKIISFRISFVAGAGPLHRLRTKFPGSGAATLVSPPIYESSLVRNFHYSTYKLFKIYMIINCYWALGWDDYFFVYLFGLRWRFPPLP